jgi:hypothetical protein
MAMISGVAIAEPDDNEIIAWWNWAAGFSRANSPFETRWGSGNTDRNDVNQPNIIYCVSCTAGNGGRDPVDRPLHNAQDSGKEILVPVFVAYGNNLNVARRLLGRVLGSPQTAPAVEFFVNGIPAGYFYRETEVGNVDFANDNSFNEPRGQTSVFSAGFWAKVSGDVTSLDFGGSGGQRDPGNTNRFETGVHYS